MRGTVPFMPDTLLCSQQEHPLTLVRKVRIYHIYPRDQSFLGLKNTEKGQSRGSKLPLLLQTTGLAKDRGGRGGKDKKRELKEVVWGE